MASRPPESGSSGAAHLRPGWSIGRDALAWLVVAAAPAGRRAARPAVRSTCPRVVTKMAVKMLIKGDQKLKFRRKSFEVAGWLKRALLRVACRVHRAPSLRLGL